MNAIGVPYDTCATCISTLAIVRAERLPERVEVMKYVWFHMVIYGYVYLIECLIVYKAENNN